jgi:pyruvate/2-oxoglutarate dehydrogenase complex dihydrolipoamide acyltransferase (E2) component
MHALIEVDVTDSRRAIREQRKATGEGLSLTAFLVACLARAVDEHKSLHAHRKGKRELVLFDDVDVAVAVERVVNGEKMPVPYVVRAANGKSPAEISREIREASSGELPYPLARRLMPAWLLVPGERIEPREFLAMTLSIDHEIVEGAPAARFTNRFKELIEGGELISARTTPARG